jgi:methylphosphotriester-DNA--protein-cysteine methyltransferase
LFAVPDLALVTAGYQAAVGDVRCRVVFHHCHHFEAAIEAGFADQSHMSRQFKLAYGFTPARWAAALVQ